MTEDNIKNNLLQFPPSNVKTSSGFSGGGGGGEVNPPSDTYKFTFKNGEEKTYKGYLILTHSFLAIAESPGEILFVAPLETILCCEKCYTVH